MLNFNKKKYVSFDNLKSFNGLLQSSLKEKLDGYKSEIDTKVQRKFNELSGKAQTDSEVIDARKGEASLRAKIDVIDNEKYSINGGKLNGKVVININNKELQIGEIDSKGNFILKTTKGSNIYIIPELEEGFEGQHRRVFIGGELRPTENAKFMNGSYDAKWEEVNTRFLRVELNEDDHGSSIADFAQNNVSNSGYIRIFDGSSGKTNTGIVKLLLGFIRKWNKAIINSNGNNLLLSTDLSGKESKKHIEITSENADILPSTTRLQNIGSAEKRFENIYAGGYIQTGRFSTSTRPVLTSTNSGAMIFDNTIQKPIWWTGTKWINANGETV